MNINATSTILIVDDEPAMRQGLADLLAEEGYNLVLTESGAEALARAAETVPDLILLDVKMPGMDGFEACRRLRADPLLGDVPIVMITSLVDRDSRLEGFEVGADDFISKPFDQLELLTRVRAIARLNRYRRLLAEQSRRREAEERYRALFDNVPIGLYRSTPDGQMMDANPALAEMMGYPDRESLLAINAVDGYADPADRKRWQALIEREGTVQGFETQWLRQDGTPIWVRESARVTWDEKGQVLYYEGAVEDITKHRRSERLLQALNKSALAMGQALTPDDIFAIVAEELKKLGFDTILLPTDESRTRLFARYLSYDSAAIKAAEKLIGLERENFSFTIDDVAEYRRVVVGRETVFVANPERLVYQILPEPLKKFAGQATHLVSIPRAIAAPLIVSGEVIGLLSVQSDDLTEDDIPAVTAFAHQVAAAWHRGTLYEQAQARSRYLETLQRINATLRSTLPLPEVLETIARGAGEALEYVGALILIPDAPDERLTLGAAWGGRFLEATIKFTGLKIDRFSVPLTATENPMIKAFIDSELRAYSGSPEQIISGVEPAISPSLAPAIAQAMGAKGAVHVPLTVEGVTVGVLVALSPREHLSAEERAVLLGLADQAGLAIHHAQLYQAAQQERDKAQRYLDIAGVMLVVLNQEGQIELINRRGCQILECEEGRILGQDWFEACLPAHMQEDVKAVFDQLMAGEIEPVEYYENPVRAKSGEERLIAWHNTVLRDEAGRIVGTLSSGEDITERKRAEGKLKILSSIIEQSTNAIAVVDKEGVIEYANPVFLERNDFQPEQVVGKNWRTFLSADATLREKYPEIRKTVLENGTVWQGEIADHAQDGKVTWREAMLFPIRDASGEITCTAYISEDITERKLVEEEIRRRNRELAALNEIGQTIASTLDLQETLTLIAHHTTQLMDMAATSVLLHDEESDDLIFAAASGGGADTIVGQRLAMGQGIAGWVAQHGEPASVPDVSQDPRWHGDFDQRGSFVTRSILCVPLRSKERVIGALEAINKEGGFTEDDLRLLRALAAPVAAAIENARLFEVVRTGREQLQALSRRLVEVQESERAYVARELHDETGQALSSLLLGLSLLEQHENCPPEVKERVLQMETMVEEMLENLHRLAMNLHPATLDHLGLAPALEQYVETFDQQHGIEAHFAAVGLGDERLPPEVETALYRIVQESLTNVFRHARATRVDVLVERRGDRIVTIVEDNGAGFDSEAAMRSSRLGLFGMRERAEMLGGTLVIESSTETGTTVFVEVPYAR